VRKICEFSKEQLDQYTQLLASATQTILPLRSDGEGPCLFLIVFSDYPDTILSRYVTSMETKNVSKMLREVAFHIDMRDDS
jgi:hypothetical protein